MWTSSRSFVREAADIQQLKALMGEKVGRVKIVAKIEDQEGVRNLEEIIRNQMASWSRVATWGWRSTSRICRMSSVRSFNVVPSMENE